MNVKFFSLIKNKFKYLSMNNTFSPKIVLNKKAYFTKKNNKNKDTFSFNNGNKKKFIPHEWNVRDSILRGVIVTL